MFQRKTYEDRLERTDQAIKFNKIPNECFYWRNFENFIFISIFEQIYGNSNPSY